MLNQAHVRLPALLLTLVLAGVLAGTFWFFRPFESAADPDHARGERSVVLSEGSHGVLETLRSPVEIRFYSLLDAETLPDGLHAFAGRIDELLAAYEREGKGQVKVIRHKTSSEKSVQAASSDGIQAFNLEKGAPAFLGLSISQGGRKESLSHLSPQWEQALESDLARAIGRVAAEAWERSAVAASAVDASATEEVKQAIPNLGSVSVAEGTQILKEAAFNNFKIAAEEGEMHIQEARERLASAQNGGSDADIAVARKQLQQIEFAQAEKLKEVAGRLQVQIAALEQLKRANP
jgi:hypothetical protein